MIVLRSLGALKTLSLAVMFLRTTARNCRLTLCALPRSRGGRRRTIGSKISGVLNTWCADGTPGVVICELMRW